MVTSAIRLEAAPSGACCSRSSRSRLHQGPREPFCPAPGEVDSGNPWRWWRTRGHGAPRAARAGEGQPVDAVHTSAGPLAFRRLVQRHVRTPVLSSGLTLRWSLLVLPETGRPGDVVGIVVLGAHGWAGWGPAGSGAAPCLRGASSAAPGVAVVLRVQILPQGLGARPGEQLNETPSEPTRLSHWRRKVILFLRARPRLCSRRVGWSIPGKLVGQSCYLLGWSSGSAETAAVRPHEGRRSSRGCYSLLQALGVSRGCSRPTLCRGAPPLDTAALWTLCLSCSRGSWTVSQETRGLLPDLPAVKLSQLLKGSTGWFPPMWNQDNCLPCAVALTPNLHAWHSLRSSVMSCINMSHVTYRLPCSLSR